MINILLSKYNFNEKWCYEKLKDIIMPNHKVLIMALSFDDNKIKNNEDWQDVYNERYGKYYNDVVNPFIDYGIKEEDIKWVNYFIDKEEEIKECILQSNILFFTGGLPDKMMEKIEELEISDYIKEFEGIVMGASAGAMMQIDEYHISPDNKDYYEFTYNKGLGLIKDFGIEVHYKGSEIEKNYINKAVREQNRVIYAIENTGGIILDSNTLELLGEVCKFE